MHSIIFGFRKYKWKPHFFFFTFNHPILLADCLISIWSLNMLNALKKLSKLQKKKQKTKQNMPDVVKLQVLSIGNTLPFLVLKSSNKKSTFYFDFQPSDFSCWIYNVNMKPQQMKLMLNGYHGLLKLKKKKQHTKK